MKENINLKSFLKSIKQKNVTQQPFRNKYPKISIITPSYNQGQYIERTILSIINQGYPNIEHIIIDGGSTDNTVKIIKKYKKQISYWISESDDGQANAINKGLRICTGELIAFQNSDDIYLPGAFKIVADEYINNPNFGVYYGNFLHIDDEDNIIDEQKLINAYYFLQVLKGPQIHNQSAFWTKLVLENIGNFNEELQFDMDYEFFSRILYHKIPVKYINKFLGAFRHHYNSKTKTLQNISKKELSLVSKMYKNKRFITKITPKYLGRTISIFYKALTHIYNGDVNYLFRNRIKFK